MPFITFCYHFANNVCDYSTFSWSSERHFSIREFRQSDWFKEKSFYFSVPQSTSTIDSSEVLSNEKNCGRSAPYNKRLLEELEREVHSSGNIDSRPFSLPAGVAFRVKRHSGRERRRTALPLLGIL